MLEKLYYALRAGNVPDDQARAAAVEVAEFRESITAIKSDLAVLKALISINLVLTVAGAGWIINLLQRAPQP